MWSSNLLCVMVMHIWGNPLTSARLLQIYARSLKAGFDPGSGKASAESCVRHRREWSRSAQAQPCLPCAHRRRVAEPPSSTAPVTAPAELPPGTGVHSQDLPAASGDSKHVALTL